MHLHDHAADMATKLAGNWQKFECFGWHSRPDDAPNWCIVYFSSRDAGLIAQSNMDAVRKTLEPFGEDVREESHGHWGVGHVDGFAVRVRDAAGDLTPAFLALTEIRLALEDYPLLDEEDHSRREYDLCIENIGDVGRRYLRDDAPEGWEGDVFSWLWDNAQAECESMDDQGAHPSDDSVQEAMVALGFADAEEDDA